MLEEPIRTGAVFLSYASEDADAAARICQALRSAGIEVWFDREELRGGDSWDMKIKQQVQECALFMPLISAHTNARSEGYFRREWKLATQRLLDISDDTAFLVPVAIDDIKEAVARVPVEFRGVHWTRVTGGEASPALSQRVLQLLGGDPANGATAHAPISAKQPSNSVQRSQMRIQRRLGLAITVLILLGLGGGLWRHYKAANDSQAANPPAANTPPELTEVSDEKSIAVLPFADMSPGKDQEYMSDGIAEELINLLAQAPDLKVIARTSSFSFKGQQMEVAEIAKKLNVAHVLEGSVRTSGDQMRITAQLIRTADSTHIWSEKYDRPLKDIFKVQDEIANAIVQALQIKLMGGTLNRRQGDTQNLQAYRLYLQAGTALAENTQESLEAAESNLRQALELDPEFGRAWSRRAWVVVGKNAGGYISTQQGYRDFRQYVEKALAVSPENAEAHAHLIGLDILEDWDWTAAQRDIKRALALEPNNPLALHHMSGIASVLGRKVEAERYARLAISHDPMDLGWVENLAGIEYGAGRFNEAERVYRSVIEREPDRPGTHAFLSTVLLVQGKADAALETLRQETDEGARIALESICLQAVGRQAEADAALTKLVERWADEYAVGVAQAYAYRGDADRTMEWLERAYRQKDTAMLNIIDEPLFNKVVMDPRFQAFVRDKLKVNREIRPIVAAPSSAAEVKSQLFDTHGTYSRSRSAGSLGLAPRYA
jgi:TolB-like protein/Flp pilus assembly protein TadD